MQKTYSFHDAHVRSLPLRLLNLAGSGLGAVGLRRPVLDAADIVAVAERTTGLDNLDDDGFSTALERFVHAADSEADLNTLGRLAVKRMLVNAVAGRLQLVDWVAGHPEARDEVIRAPWIVVGLPRTGTSLLSSLLGVDPFSRPLLQWEARHPIPPADPTTALDDPRIEQYRREVGQAIKMNPPIAAMHPFGSSLAEECTALFMYALRTIGMETIAFAPGYGQWLDTADMQPAYSTHSLLLRCLQHTQPTERWVLKSPNHLWCLDTLMTVYPDARIIWTHRDPAVLVPSLASLNCAMQAPLTNKLDHRSVGEYWASKVDTAIDRATAFDASAEPGWCCHIHYDALINDPVAAVEKIYHHFGEEVSELHRRRINSWLKHRPQDAAGRHTYDARDFGWTSSTLAERYQHYRQRFDVVTGL